jgi:hypothetical protein
VAIVLWDCVSDKLEKDTSKCSAPASVREQHAARGMHRLALANQLVCALNTNDSDKTPDVLAHVRLVLSELAGYALCGRVCTLVRWWTIVLPARDARLRRWVLLSVDLHSYRA